MPTPIASRLRGALSAVLLLAATVGLPFALGVTIGDPLRHIPSLTAGQLTDTDVIDILAIVFWLAWVSFAVPAVLEITLAVRARITRRPARTIRIPLLGSQQDLARHLVAAALVLLPAHSATLASASAYPRVATNVGISEMARTTRVVALPAHSTNGHQPDATGRGRTYVIPNVGGMRSYWALAEHYLGDGTRWREIWRLNQGRDHTDGTVMDTPRQLHAGWTIRIPAADHGTGGDHARHDRGSRQVTVEPGDTLSGIAAAHGVTSWQQLWHANTDRHEPDGARLTDPNLIYPGWTLRLPRSSAPTPPPAGHGVNPTASTHPRHTTGSVSPDGTPPEAPDSASPPPPTPVTTTATNPGTRHDTSPASTSSVAPEGGAERRDEHRAPSHRFPVVPLEVGLAALAAVASLDRARRLAQRRRRIGQRPLPPPPPLRRVEADLRRNARATAPAIAAVELAAALTATSPTLVQIHTVIARDDHAVDLYLDQSTGDLPPLAPFVAVPGGWRLPAAATGFTFAVDSVDEPVPTLAPVGRITDGEVLVDLAGHGPVSVAGDSDMVTGFLTQLAEALLAAPWSGRVVLTVPDAYRDSLGDHEHVTVDDGPPVLPATVPPVATGAEEPGWCTTPIYLYLGWAATDPVEDLLEVAADPATGIYTILNGARQSTTVWTLDGDQLTIPGLDQPVTVTVPAPSGPDATDLIGFTRTAPYVAVGDPRLPDHTADAPPHKATTSRQLNVLGPVELAGVATPRRTQILNLLTYLALHRHGADHDTLDTVLWKQQVGGKTLRNRIHEARRLVDGAITDGPIWQLTDVVTTDWQRFTALAAGTPTEQHEALQLIRGRPFEGLDYADWLDLDGVRSDVEATIVDLALTVAERELDAGNPDAAYRAAKAGLDASRYEERLHRLAIHAAQTAGYSNLVNTLKTEMRKAIDDDIEPDDTMQPQTLDLYERIRRPRVTAKP